MNKFKILLALALLASSALAQSAMDAGKGVGKVGNTDQLDSPADRAQRRAELRAALRPTPAHDSAARNAGGEPAGASRLSPRQRAELRQQLRALQGDKAGKTR